MRRVISALLAALVLCLVYNRHACGVASTSAATNPRERFLEMQNKHVLLCAFVAAIEEAVLDLCLLPLTIARAGLSLAAL
jgi:hypothetical protein